MQRSVFCIILMVSLGLMVTRGRAQQKIGFVNTDTILSQIPEYKGVQQQLSRLGEQWRRHARELQQKIDTLQKDFDAKKILLGDEQKAERRQQIQQLIAQRKNYIDQKFGANGDYFNQQQQLLKPIQRKVYGAITTVAKRQDIDFVFDRAENASLLYGRKQWNLNENVLQQLDITLNEQ